MKNGYNDRASAQLERASGVWGKSSREPEVVRAPAMPAQPIPWRRVSDGSTTASKVPEEDPDENRPNPTCLDRAGRARPDTPLDLVDRCPGQGHHQDRDPEPAIWRASRPRRG